jgi:hypothetical protein
VGNTVRITIRVAALDAVYNPEYSWMTVLLRKAVEARSGTARCGLGGGSTPDLTAATPTTPSRCSSCA